MAVARTRSVAVVGVAGHLVEVEADLAAGLPGMSIVGLPDTAVGEARDRARAAVHNSGLAWPTSRITVGLSPAGLPKRGPTLDLAIAVAVLAAAGRLPATVVADVVIVGELGLDGRVRPVRGVLVAAMTARRCGTQRMVVPAANAAEAALVPGLEIIAVGSLRDLVARWSPADTDDPATPSDGPPAVDAGPDADVGAGPDLVDPAAIPESLIGVDPGPEPDLADVRGHPVARAALEIAAAGGHHLAMVGPPGVGKTLLARRLPGLLPDLSRDEALEVTAVHSVAGRLPGGALVRRPPLAAPHHRASHAAVVGGGSAGRVRLGLVSLAHRGVLLLDEAPEFAPSVLDSLREPLEHGEIEVARAGFSVRLPARFLLVLAANPCPCGLGSDPVSVTGAACSCSPLQRRRYLGRLSGPLLDRVDLRLHVERPTAADLAFDDRRGESTSVVAARVAAARERAARRLQGTPWRTNGDVPGPYLRRHLRPDADAAEVLDTLVADPRRTARGLDRLARVAWTVADLAGRDRPGRDDVWTAQGLRDSEDRWAA